MMKHWYFFSFSLEGVNQGCIQIQAENEEEAIDKMESLDIVPKSDDIRGYLCTQQEIPENILVSREYFKERDYKIVES